MPEACRLSKHNNRPRLILAVGLFVLAVPSVARRLFAWIATVTESVVTRTVALASFVCSVVAITTAHAPSPSLPCVDRLPSLSDLHDQICFALPHQPSSSRHHVYRPCILSSSLSCDIRHPSHSPLSLLNLEYYAQLLIRTLRLAPNLT